MKTLPRKKVVFWTALVICCCFNYHLLSQASGEDPTIVYGEMFLFDEGSFSSSITSLPENRGDVEGVAFNTDGTKLFLVEAASVYARVFQYTLSNPYDVKSSMSLDGSLDVSDEDESPTGILFDPEGNKMFLTGTENVAIYQYSLSSPFDITSTVTYDGDESVFSREATPTGLTFNDDGSRLLFVGASGDEVNSFSLSSDYSITGGVGSVTGGRVDLLDHSPQDIQFNSDGSSMFVLGSDTDVIRIYSLSVAFTPSSIDIENSFLVDDDSPTSFAFDQNRQKMFVVGKEADQIEIYTLPVAIFEETSANDGAIEGSMVLEISDDTFTNAGSSLSASDFSIDGLPDGLVANLAVDADGLSATLSFFGNATENSLDRTPVELEITFENSAFTTHDADEIEGGISKKLPIIINFLENPTIVYGETFDITGGIEKGETAEIVDEEVFATGVTFNADGTKVYICGQIGDDITQYALDTPFDISSGLTLEGTSESLFDDQRRITDIAFSSDGFDVFVVGDFPAKVSQYSLSTAFDVTEGLTLEVELDVSDEQANPQSMAFSETGTSLYTLGDTENEINRYTLSSAFDLNSASWNGRLDISDDVTRPRGMFFSTYGNYLNILDITQDEIIQYPLSSAFNPTTSTLGTAVTMDIIDAGGQSEGGFFMPDGRTFVIVDLTSNELVQMDINRGGFTETSSNDGSVEGQLVIYLEGDTFTNSDDNLTEGSDYTIDNLPSGLTPSIAVSSDGLTATLTLSGTAGDHRKSDSIEDLQFTFTSSAFSSSTVDIVVNAVSASSDISITFQNNEISWIGGASGLETDWATAANWSSSTVPDGTDEVTIPTTANDPIISTDEEVLHLAVETEAALTIHSGASLAIWGTATVDGTYTVERNTTGNAGLSIVSAPISDATVSNLSADYNYAFDGTDFSEATGTMSPGEGYFIGYDDATPQISFTGIPNTGDIMKPVTDGNFELVGNPYAAPLSITAFLTDNSTVIAGAVYFWNDGGSNASGSRGGDYVTANVIGSVSAVEPGGVDDGVHGSQASGGADEGVIPSVQGVFVEAIATGNVTFSSDMQTMSEDANVDDNFYRVAGKPTVKLSMQGTGFYDELLVGFLEDATRGRDWAYDAQKLISDESASFYSLIDEDRFAIQGIPLYGVYSVPLEMKNQPGKYLLNTQFSHIPEGWMIHLMDRSTGETYLLEDHVPLELQLEEFSRFDLTIHDVTLEMDDLNSGTVVYGTTDNLHLLYTSGYEKEKVAIYTLTGRVIFRDEVQFNHSKATIQTRLEADQIYFLRIGGQSIKFIVNQ